MPSYDDLKNHQSKLIRKALKGSFFLADEDVDPLLALTAGADALLAPLPAPWDDLGLLSNDGVAAANEQSSSDVTSWGYTSPTRSDVMTDTTTLTVVAQETKVLTLGLYTGADMSVIVPDATTGEVAIDKSARPSTKHYRGLLLAVDETDEGEVYIGRSFHRLKVTGKADQAYGGGDEPVAYGVTLQTYVDDALGTSERWLFGGPGWRAQLAAMGFAAPPATP